MEMERQNRMFICTITIYTTNDNGEWRKLNGEKALITISEFQPLN